MRVLVADDDPAMTELVAVALERWKLDVTVVHDGGSAWDVLNEEIPPRLAILDWVMPTLDGLEICRRMRREVSHTNPYLMLVTARANPADVVAGFDAGADDYLIKPFDPEELRARVHVGIRLVTLQDRLADRVAELQAALSKLKQLSGLLPICSYCKRIRTDQNYWEQVDSYVSQYSNAQFSHGICPDCYEEVCAEIDR